MTLFLTISLPCGLLRDPDDAESPPLLLELWALLDLIRHFHHSVYISAKEGKKKAVILPIHILGLDSPRQGPLHLDVVTEKGTVEGPEDEVQGCLGVGGGPHCHSQEPELRDLKPLRGVELGGAGPSWGTAQVGPGV